MSLILDALKRSRQDTSQVPGVDTYHSLEDLSPPWRRYLPWLALLAALALIAWLLLDRAGQTKSVPVPAPAAVVAPSAPEQLTAQAAPAVPAPKTARPPAPIAVPQPVSQPPSASRLPTAPVAESALEAEQKAQAEREAAVAALYRGSKQQTAESALSQQPQQEIRQSQNQPEKAQVQKTSPKEQVKEQPIDIEQMLESARSEMDRVDLAEHSAPFINSLSQQTKNAIPTVLYQRHDYSGKASQASVVMNGKTLRVGGSPAAGIKLDEILPNSAVLSYRGTQFRLKALNSWVNL